VTQGGATEAELVTALELVTAALTYCRVQYFVTGSFASSIHGVFRATNDVDIVAAFDDTDLDRFVERVSAEFVADIDQARAAVATASSFNLIHRGTYLKIDLFPCLTAFDREAARRAEPVALRGTTATVRVASREDILLAKLRWYRMGGEQSESQRRDVQGLIALNRSELDVDYLRRWAAELDLGDLLSRFLTPV
jgi:hypothetical protein